MVRGSGLFGWSGWIVALIVCVAFAMLATRPGGLAASVSRAEATRVADLSPANRRSQPAERPVHAESSIEAAIESLARPGPLPVAKPVEERLAASAADARRRDPASLQQRARSRSASKAPPRPPTRQERDFLEREGYIY
jgi:hypothetical protein